MSSACNVYYYIKWCRREYYYSQAIIKGLLEKCAAVSHGIRKKNENTNKRKEKKRTNQTFQGI